MRCLVGSRQRALKAEYVEKSEEGSPGHIKITLDIGRDFGVCKPKEAFWWSRLVRYLALAQAAEGTKCILDNLICSPPSSNTASQVIPADSGHVFLFPFLWEKEPGKSYRLVEPGTHWL